MYHRSVQKTPISTNEAPKAIGPYSQAIAVGDLVFCSGQIALDPQTGEIVGQGDVKAETHQVMLNLKAVLKAAGIKLSHAVKATIYLLDMSEFSEVNEVYASYFGGEIPPARATVAVAELPALRST